MNARAVSAAAALLAAPLLACQPRAGAPGATAGPDASPDAQELAAEIDGRPITMAELDAYIKEGLFERETRGRNPGRLFQVRKSALEEMLQKRILEAAAESAGVEVDALIEREASELGPVEDEEVASFYEQNKERMGDATLEEISPRIRSFLESQRRELAVASLLEGADVEVHLEEPRLEVAADGPARGAEQARVTIVEFSDFQCPYCKRAEPIMKELLERYPNDLKVVYRHLPLERIHPRAFAAAEASMCADDQGRFWDYHDVLFENTRELEDEDLVRYAGDLGLDAEKFQQCLDTDRHTPKIRGDMSAATSAGITGTPAFVVNGRLLSGALPVEEFVEIIDEELAANEPPPAGVQGG